MGNMQEIPSTANIVQWNQVSERDGLSHIDRLYQRFQGIYMQKWASQFTSDAMLTNWKETWGEGLNGLNADQVRRGLNGCANLDWPPSLPEFRRLCIGNEPQRNYEAMFREAAELAGKRLSGIEVTWPNALSYWAARNFGMRELASAAWQSSKSLWIDSVDAAMEMDPMPPIPVEEHKELPAPGKTTVTAEVVHQRIQEFTATKMVGAKTEEKNEWGISPSHHLMTVHRFPKFNASIAVAAMRRLRWPEGKVQRFVIEVWGLKDQVYIAKLLGHELE